MRLGTFALALMLAGASHSAFAQETEWEDSEEVASPEEQAETQFYALVEKMGQCFGMDQSEKPAERSDAFAALAREIAAARPQIVSLDDWAGKFAEQEGVAWFYAAEVFFLIERNEAQELKMAEYLAMALAALEPVMATKTEIDGPTYEYGNAATELAELGRARNDPRWPDWSAAKVRAMRFRVRMHPDDASETSPLAEALYDHGWLTKDMALLAEADTIAATIPEVWASADLDYKRAAVAAGEAPYLAPGVRDN